MIVESFFDHFVILVRCSCLVNYVTILAIISIRDPFPIEREMLLFLDGIEFIFVSSKMRDRYSLSLPSPPRPIPSHRHRRLEKFNRPFPLQ